MIEYIEPYDPDPATGHEGFARPDAYGRWEWGCTECEPGDGVFGDYMDKATAREGRYEHKIETATHDVAGRRIR